jgi:hypothetical protein
MTKGELEQQGAEIQTQLNELGIELLSKNQLGIKLIILIAIRIKDGDYETEIPKFEDAPIGTAVIDNDA